MEKSNLELLRELNIEIRRTGKTTCPKCSHTRKKKKDPCLSVNIEDGWYRCFHGDTKVLTKDGYVNISDLSGKNVKVLTEGSKWVNVDFYDRGFQNLYKLTLLRDRKFKEILVTSDHEWIVNGSKKRVFTKDLKTNQYLKSVVDTAFYPSEEYLKSNDCLDAVRNGFIYGDGTLKSNGRKSIAYFFGEKIKYMSSFFSKEIYRWVPRSDNGFSIFGFRPEFKSIPDTKNKEYLYNFMRGYFAADGDVTVSGIVSLNSSNINDLKKIESICIFLGFTTMGIKTYNRKGINGFSDIHRIKISSVSLTDNFFLNPSHRVRFVNAKHKYNRLRWKVVSVENTDRFEKVYCPIVPETHSFVIEGNILTGNCHNCSWSGRVFNKRKYVPKPKTYIKPQAKNITEVSSEIVNWFFSRGITPMTVKKFKITEGVKFFPQVSENRGCMEYNYFRDGELVNIKYRDHQKNFMLHKDSELIFYNLDAIKDSKTAIIVEGECFTGDAEVLTEEGWVRLDLYNDGKAMQVNDDLTSSFVDPICRVEKEFDGRLIEYSNNQKFYSLTTPDHNMVVYNPRTNQFKKEKARDLSVGVHIPRTVIFDGPGVDLTDEQLRLCVAVSADFTFRQSGDLYCALKKDRKKDRLENLLKKVGIPYSLNIDGRGYYSFFIRRGDNPGFLFKKFPKEWISKLSKSQAGVILEEILHWDGNSVPDRNQIEYSSKEMDNAVFVQTLSHLHGYTSTIIDRENDFEKWFKVSILFSKKHSDSQSLLKNKKEISHSGKVYCVQVPSGKILIRQNRCISVSGNCDAMILDQIGLDNVVSVPNGATLSNNPNLDYLENCIDYFDSKEKIIIATDNDDAGRKLRDELARRFGKHRCYKVDLSDQKDANDYFNRYGEDNLKSVFSNENLKEFPIDGVITIDDVWEDVEYLFKNGLQKGDMTGIMPELDKHISFVPGQTCVVTGVPNHGKSPFVLMVAAALSVKHGWKWAFFSPEHKPLSIFIAKICELLLGKRLRQGVGFMQSEKDLARDFIREHFFFVEPENGDNTVDSVIDKCKHLVMSKGVKGCIFDPWNKFEHKLEKGENETTYISRALDEIIYFGQNFGVFNFIIAHPTKIRKNLATGKYEVPTLYDIAGSANWYNKPDWGITFYRDFVNNVSTIYIQKAKWEHLGMVGFVEVKYNVNNGRFVPIVRDWDNSNWILPETLQGDLFSQSEIEEPVPIDPIEESPVLSVVDADKVEDAPF